MKDKKRKNDAKASLHWSMNMQENPFYKQQSHLPLNLRHHLNNDVDKNNVLEVEKDNEANGKVDKYANLLCNESMYLFIQFMSFVFLPILHK